VSELYQPSDRCLSVKLAPIFADRSCRVVSVADPYGSVLDFLDRRLYHLFQVAPELYSRGWVDPIPIILLTLQYGNYSWIIKLRDMNRPGPEIQEYGHRDPLRLPRGTLYPQ
jgi:hypothetical protein